MDNPQSLTELQSQILQFTQNEKYQEALNLLETQRHLVDRPDIYFHLRSMLLVLSGDSQSAICTLQEALDKGIWWPPVLLRDEPNFKSLLGNPEFEFLLKQCTEKYAAASHKSRPERLVLKPDEAAVLPPYPVLMALHGRGANLHSDEAQWSGARKQGWLTALIGSSQLMGQEIYSWDDRFLAVGEVNSHFEQLRQQEMIDTSRVVLGGFSQSAGLVTHLILNRGIPASGIIAVSPSGLVEDDFTRLKISKGLKIKRAVILVGEEDHLTVKTARHLADLLQDKNVPCIFTAYKGLGHAFPGDFKEKLGQYLEFLSGAEPIQTA